MKFIRLLLLASFFLFWVRPARAFSEGDLVINEIMKDPAAVADSAGEWFEIYNPTDQEIDLRGLLIKDEDTDDFLIEGTEPVWIEAFGYLVFGREADETLNGGVEVDYEYAGFNLANGEDEILIREGETEIDRVVWDDGVDWPDPTGAAMALTDPSLDNNLGSNWTTATESYGAGDLGTPGEANFPAPTPTPTLTPTPTPTPTLTPGPGPFLPRPPMMPEFSRRILRRTLRRLWSIWEDFCSPEF